MFILSEPYVSDFLVSTIRKNGYSVLDNETAGQFFSPQELTDEATAQQRCRDGEPVYTNSENSLAWLRSNLSQAPIAEMIHVSKDKTLFRRTVAQLYPDYRFREVSYEALLTIDAAALTYPLVLKPSVGFLSLGVYEIRSEQDWNRAVSDLTTQLDHLGSLFPADVVDTGRFILEQCIEGDEYAVDAYYDADGAPVILNIFRHPFSGEGDVADRVYYTSKAVMQEHLAAFTKVLAGIGSACGYRNFPVHAELRTDGTRIIPIEINPLRFAGWCITDAAWFMWGINVYECYMNGIAPDWEAILAKADDSYRYFAIGALPQGVNGAEVSIDYAAFMKNFARPLELRRIDYTQKPLFGVVFANTNDYGEMQRFLALDMASYVKPKA